MGIIRKLFGNYTDVVTNETLPVYKFKISNDANTESTIEVHVLSYGAGICGVLAPGRDGSKDNVVLGFDTLQGYLDHSYQGSTIGRCANRINAGKFSLSSQGHQLTLNNNGNHLHGGIRGWDKRVWSSSVTGNSVVFTLVSEEGDQGYPGTVMAQVRYSLTAGNELTIVMTASASAVTPINMTNHAFFNLAGHGMGRKELLNHSCELKCDKYLPVTDSLIPTGEQRAVEGTAFDLRKGKSFKKALLEVEGGGYDHCFVLHDGNRGTLTKAATFIHELSGRTLEVFTTEPGIQLYTGNFLPAEDGMMVGRDGKSYTKQGAFACEPQNFPDAVNHESFPCSVLEPGETYKHTIVYKFTCQTVV